jgi:signal transduction histidine kinase/CheY-like chemotaxis protein
MVEFSKSRCVPPKAATGRLQRFVQAACQATDAHGSGMVILSTTGDILDHITYQLSEDQADQIRQAPTFVQFVENVLRQPGGARCRMASSETAALEMSSLLGVALPWLGGQRGVLYAVRPFEKPFDDAHLAALRAIGTLLEQESLTEEPHLIAKLRLLNQLAQAAADQRDLHGLLNLAIKELDRHVPMQAVAVWLLNDLGEHELFDCGDSLLVLEGMHDRARNFGLHAGLEVGMTEVVFADCLHKGEAHYIDRTIMAASKCPVSPAIVKGGASACFVVPLRAGKRILGVLQSICTRADGFTNEEIQLYYLVADLLGPAIAQAVLFQRLRGAYEELRNTQSQLIQNEKMRALGEMASGMAHDFNNALCGVLGFLDLALLDHSVPAACRGYLEASKTCAQDAAHTVRRVQEFARRQRTEGAMHLLELDDLVKQIVELTRPRWESLQHVMERPISVNVFAESGCTINGCAAELREALTNLIFNAVDAMPHGGILTIRTAVQHGNAVVTVEDTGSGIPEDCKRRLFEPFFTTKGEKGTGLGLSVTFGIIRRHQGVIDVESEVGKGSRFTIRLPIWEDDEGGTGAPRSAVIVRASQPGSRVLVVDDEEGVRRFLSAGLQQLGYETHASATAEDALEVLSEQDFDIVLTDLGLPGMSGDDFARAVHEQNPRTPIVLLTGWGDQIKAENRHFDGVTHVLSKPVSLGALAQTLAAVCAV